MYHVSETISGCFRSNVYQTGIKLDFDLHSEKNLYNNSWPYTKANLIDLSDLVINILFISGRVKMYTRTLCWVSLFIVCPYCVNLLFSPDLNEARGFSHYHPLLCLQIIQQIKTETQKCHEGETRKSVKYLVIMIALLKNLTAF